MQPSSDVLDHARHILGALGLETQSKAFEYYQIDKAVKRYHNWKHVRQVMHALFCINQDPLPEQLLAVLWHDAVYMPSAGEDANERCSAAALGLAARGCRSQHVVQAARDIILQTAVSSHFGAERDPAEAASAVLDADLWSLSTKYSDFEQNQLNIIHEQGADDSAETRVLSARFLDKFLACREFIYHTEYARENWEERARQNLLQWSSEAQARRT